MVSLSCLPAPVDDSAAVLLSFLENDLALVLGDVDRVDVAAGLDAEA